MIKQAQIITSSRKACSRLAVFVMMIAVGLLVISIDQGVVYSQQSKPVRKDADQPKSKFSDTSAISAEEVKGELDATKIRNKRRCKHEIGINWRTNVDSSVYQTPYITNLMNVNSGQSADKKQIIVPTFVRYIQVLNGDSGAEHKEGNSHWPYTHSQLASHSSVLLYDINGDNIKDVVVTTANGEILFFNWRGELLTDFTIAIPGLMVDKFWYKGLENDKFDVSLSLSQKESEKHAEEAKSKRKQKDQTTNKGTNDNTQTKRKLLQLAKAAPGTEGLLSSEARASLSLIQQKVHTPQSLRPFLGEKLESSEHHQHYSHHTTIKKGGKEYITVDAHVLSTPVIADIDGDGKDELIVSVSYFYDREYYHQNMFELDVDIDMDKYVAGGIAVYDLSTRKIKWDVHLDMTTDTVKQKAYIYGNPTVADVDGDGSLDVVIGTGLGWIYAYNSHGKLLDGFPILMGEIQGQVIAEDVNNDGFIEICAVDFNSNLACFNGKGKEIWSQRLSGSAAQAPSVGDINGDGKLELVVGTSTGHVWAVDGETGNVLKPFPIKTGASIYSPALLVDLTNSTSSNDGSLDIVLPSFDGYLYIINGKTGCIDRVDIGEKAYSQVLADDLTGNGKLDLLVSTMNGNLICLSTEAPYHPLKATPYQMQYENGFKYRDNMYGIYFKNREYRDVIGSTVGLDFEIVDNRKTNSKDRLPVAYNVRILLGANKVLYEGKYQKAGYYRVEVNTPEERTHNAIITVELRNEFGQLFTDNISLSFNIGFFSLLKWMVFMPFIASLSAILYTLRAH
ncbi:hypothetical protein FDP41_013202 [Naegleria fowleri]|uniref:DEX1 C-terminal domain-containing protein n=1 Tax=Naegleria fowleri TaxID=5763 RepID=A0A6A5C5X7_NAEFO|nr:uncharacterized protein FDP41_013202 [Naegleria fowleri]KAF0980719.1 hypothetical protein FDP41_013202 [Naegleria fowleri]